MNVPRRIALLPDGRRCCSVSLRKARKAEFASSTSDGVVNDVVSLVLPLIDEVA